MKRMMILMMVLFVGAVPVMAARTGTYVDVTPSNTVAIDGTDPWYSAGTAGLWKERFFGNPGGTGALYEIYGTSSSAWGGPDLKTTIGGLTPGLNYDIRVIHWSKSETENWQVLAGVTPERSEALLCDFLTGMQTGGVTLVTVLETEELIGTATADASGNITAYTFDTEVANRFMRSWMDGFTYEIAYKAYNPSPTNGAVEVPTSSALTCSSMRDPNNPTLEHPTLVEHRVYFRDDPNLVEDNLIATIAQGGTLEVTPSLVENKTYYWRVDEVIDVNTIVTGAKWSFSTVKTLPDFDPPLGSQPENTEAFLGESASFTAAAGTTGGLGGTINYQWYKGQPGDTSNPVSGAISSVLALTSVTAADQGYYFCRATNDVGFDDSQAVSLLVKRLLSHYEFEGDLLDSVGDKDGSMADPNFAGSIAGLGQAIKLDGIEYVDLGTDAYPKAGLGNGLESGSASLWFNAPSVIDLSFVGVFNGIPGENVQAFDMGVTAGNQLYGFVRDDSAAFYQPIVTLSGSLADEWHMLTVTWDNVGGVALMYLDGVLIDGATGAPTEFSDWTYSMILGGRQNRGTIEKLFTGLIDDYRVYNYPLTAYDVATLYTDIETGESICVEIPDGDVTGPAGEPDCIVNLYDLGELAAIWLDCNLVPASACGL